MIREVSIVPTILSDNKKDYRTQIERINVFTRRVQIDVTDGVFAPTETLDITNIWWPKGWETDLHMMVAKPSECLETIFKLMPSYIEAADHVLVFAGKLGVQGGTADLLQMEKIALIRNIKPELEIGWDGGANMSNIRALAHVDLDVINVGSALANADDPALVFEQMVSEIDKNGVVL